MTLAFMASLMAFTAGLWYGVVVGGMAQQCAVAPDSPHTQGSATARHGPAASHPQSPMRAHLRSALRPAWNAALFS